MCVLCVCFFLTKLLITHLAVIYFVFIDVIIISELILAIYDYIKTKQNIWYESYKLYFDRTISTI